MIATEDIAKPKSSEWMTQPVGSGINAQAAVTHSARDRERERERERERIGNRVKPRYAQRWIGRSRSVVGSFIAGITHL